MTNKKEEWRDIPEYEGIYMISSRGRAKGLKGILSTYISNTGYIRLKIYKPRQKGVKRVTINLCMHQLVAIAFLDHVPCGNKIVVDHIDNDKTNNNLNNLQLISHRENSSKDKKGGSSKYVGVYWDKPSRKWRAQIYINGKKKHLGFFTNELDASEAYHEALKNI
jgi:hypothetical protein